MCETRGTREATLRQPRWEVLYAATLPQIAALGAVEVVQSPPAVRLALRCLLALGVFVAMACGSAPIGPPSTFGTGATAPARA
jgi:hypothetical protein